MDNIWDREENKKLVETLLGGGIVVMPTDTIYGIVARAEDERVVERIYSARRRNSRKPCIILISEISELHKFSIDPSAGQKKILEKFWLLGFPPTSVVLDCENKRLAYLHRGAETLAFRIPKEAGLQKLLKQSGPLIAPSANPEDLPPAQNISEAKKYFGDSVDLYVDGGEMKGQASKIIRLHKDGSVDVLR